MTVYRPMRKNHRIFYDDQVNLKYGGCQRHLWNESSRNNAKDRKRKSPASKFSRTCSEAWLLTYPAIQPSIS